MASRETSFPWKRGNNFQIGKISSLEMEKRITVIKPPVMPLMRIISNADYCSYIFSPNSKAEQLLFRQLLRIITSLWFHM